MMRNPGSVLDQQKMVDIGYLGGKADFDLILSPMGNIGIGLEKTEIGFGKD